MSDKLSEPTRGTAVTLFNRFAELMLVVGLDENTGLVPVKKDTDSYEEGDDLYNWLFINEYEAQVIAAISASKALVFHPYLREDTTYPPSAESMNNLGIFQTLKSRSEKHASRKISAHRMTTVNPAILKQHLTTNDQSSASATSVSDLPLSKDAIEGITTFCFPDNAHIYSEKPDNSIHFLVLTDMSGSKTYATCLTFYKPYRLTKAKDGNITFILNKSTHKIKNEDPIVNCYIPQCCVLVSKYPYFYAMKECLSCMISHVERDLEEMNQFLKDFTYTMTMAPVPPAGDVVVEMSICNLSVSLFPSESPEKPVIDLPLHLAFLCFQIDDLLKIFTAILCEERLVFVSFNYALLTTVMESFLYFILPFNWRFTYVPILSSSCLELLDAPGTFMMGCHSKHLHDVVKVSGLIVVNIDEGTVSVNSPDLLTPTTPTITRELRLSFEFLEHNSHFPSLPVEPADIFKNICKRSKFQVELSDVQRPFYYNMEEERALRMKKSLQFNTEISFVFLEMMVNLFRGTLYFLRIEHSRFNKALFMDTIAECDKPFYEKVLKTDMFKQFLEDRLKGKVDYWSDYEKKTQPYTKRTSGPIASSVAISQRHKHKSAMKQVSITTFNSMSKRAFEVFRLPTLNDSVSYVKNTIIRLNRSIQKCESIHMRSSYIYLRGMFHAAEGNVNSALSDLLSLHAQNARLLPMGFVHKLLQLVPEAEREEMLRKRGITDYRDPGPGRPTPRAKFMGEVPIPDCDLSVEVFVQTVSLLEMAIDFDTIQRLFMALASADRPTYVDKYTFDVFRLCYDENLAQCDALVIPDDSLQVSELVLKVSNLIKTDFGMGRIVLTDKRLFFIKDVSNKCKEIVKLRNIAKLEKVQYYSLLRPVDALLISETGNKVKFAAWLKSERNCWALLIEEMRAGKIVAEATKDFSAIGHAVQNVLLIDAVIKSGQDESTAHYGQITLSAETLCYFTLYMADGRHILPQDTTSALQHRVDPNIGQRERKTVIVMLYTAGRSNNSIPPRLWCGMGDGKVRVFDATNWTLEEGFIQTKSNVAALIAVGDYQVWAGSHGIFIIDTDTISCNKTLSDHPDFVVDIVVLTHQGRYAYSASVDGTIIKWELQTLQAVKKITLSNVKNLRSMKLYNDKLWCGTWQSIMVMDFEGKLLRTFTHTHEDSGRVIDLDCFEVFNDELWVGCRRESQVIVWSEVTSERVAVLQPYCNGVSALMVFGDKVWVGTKDGTIYIYDAVDKQLWKTIKAHDDAVRSLCAAESRYIMSGSGSKDGKVAIWSPNVEINDPET